MQCIRQPKFYNRCFRIFYTWFLSLIRSHWCFFFHSKNLFNIWIIRKYMCAEKQSHLWVGFDIMLDNRILKSGLTEYICIPKLMHLIMPWWLLYHSYESIYSSVIGMESVNHLDYIYNQQMREKNDIKNQRVYGTSYFKWSI